MKAFYKFILISLILSFFVTQNSFSQYASKRVKSKYEAYTDSLKKVDYHYVFPFWGQKAYQRGIDLQYPIGIMANYFWMTQGIVINNFQLGINKPDGSELLPLTPLDDEILSFGNNTNQSWSLNIRPDIWLFPFIDLYGIFGYGRSSTTVEAVLLGKPLPTKPVEQGITTSGVGVLLAGGLGPVRISLDANITWNKPELLDKATMANVVGIRMGKVFTFKNRPQSNISVWIGTMFVTMQNETLGYIKLNEAIDDYQGVKDEIVGNINEKINDPETGPIKKKLLEKLRDAVDESTGESTIAYNMDKQVKAHWNGLIGMQYQINKNWQLRGEGGVIGDRKSFLISLNYRILGFTKKSKFNP